MTEQPIHEQGTAVARHDPWYWAWHYPSMGWLVCRFDAAPTIKIWMDEYMGIAYLEAFRQEDGLTTVGGRRVIAAAFVLVEVAREPVQ
jgi:hypothetical protein